MPLILDDVPRGLTQVLAQEGVPFRSRMAGSAKGRFLLFDSRRGRCPTLLPGQMAIDVDRLRDAFEGDPFEQLLDETAERHQWNVAGLVVSEEIARVDRRAIRRRLIEKLRARIEQAGGVWLCVGAFPYPYRSAVNVRIDYDRYDEQDFYTLMQVIDGEHHATSHFVCGAAYEPHPSALARLRGLDVGTHGYHHHTYLTESENLRNIRRGMETLAAAGIEPSGFAAPHGRFHRGLLAAMESLEIGHSGEFALAYDDLPFFPYGGTVLQIPVHPICLGLFLDTVQGDGPRRIAATQQAVRTAVDYFRQVARQKYHAGEPVFLYGHPTGRLGRYPQVLRAVFDTVGEFGAAWKVTCTRFADWWRHRATVRLTVVRRDDQFVVKTESLPREFRMAIEYHRGRHVARMHLDHEVLRFSPTALAYENLSPRPTFQPVRVDAAHTLRSHVRRVIDWEKETPPEEIPLVNWRNLAKRVLRQFRS